MMTILSSLLKCHQYTDLVRARFSSCTKDWRDVGCCSHVAALLWHLGVCRGNIDSNNYLLSTSYICSQIDGIAFNIRMLILLMMKRNIVKQQNEKAAHFV